MNSNGRLSGILLPLISVRARTDFGIGDFGSLGPLFEWMQAAGQRLWMLLPLLPTTAGDPSPYSTCSAFGLNPLFIDLQPLLARYGVSLSADEQQRLAQARQAPTVRYDLVLPLKAALLERVFSVFEQAAEPSFDAFCPAGTVETLVKPENKGTLTTILTYHVVPGRVTSMDLVKKIKAGKGKAVLTTVQGEPLTASLMGKRVMLTDAKGGKSMVTIANVMQSNGVIHVVDTVLMP